MKKLTLIIFTFITSSTFAQEIFLPPLNARVIQFVNKNIGKKVDKGECWDLAFRALEAADAKLIDTYIFGEVVKKGQVVYSGDIIQFEKVRLVTEQKDGTIIIQDIPHHTAIVYEVLGNLNFSVADQNNGISGKKVSVNPLNLNDIIKGKYTIFRPIKK